MKKLTAIALVLVLCFAVVLGCSCAKKEDPKPEQQKAPFEVGTDATTYKVDGSASYASTVTANVKIVAGDAVLYNGKVTLTSDNLYASEFAYAAIQEKELACEGVLEGFITSIGSYAQDATTNTYWMWYYNGHVPTNFAINDVHIFDGDYVLVSLEAVQW